MQTYVQHPKDYCLDCNINTFLIGEYYMVHTHVWSQTNLGPYDGMLCISCLEKRINRPLVPQDFSSFPINTADLFRSDLLISRLFK